MTEPTAEQRADILYRQFEEWGECPRGCIAAEIRAAEATAYRRGQEEMRERCRLACEGHARSHIRWGDTDKSEAVIGIADRIAALPLTEDKTP